MRNIREHYALLQYVLYAFIRSDTVSLLDTISPEREQPIEVEAPIEYTTLQPSHLDQVHDLLSRAFWAGIDGKYCCTDLDRSAEYLQLAIPYFTLRNAALSSLCTRNSSSVWHLLARHKRHISTISSSELAGIILR
jgi:hypothetical protein